MSCRVHCLPRRRIVQHEVRRGARHQWAAMPADAAMTARTVTAVTLTAVTLTAVTLTAVTLTAVTVSAGTVIAGAAAVEPANGGRADGHPVSHACPVEQPGVDHRRVH